MTARRFEGRTVLVTGASRGLGRAIAAAFAAEGAFVAAGYLAREKDVEQTLSLVREAGSDGRAFPFDVKKRPEVDAAVDAILTERGRIDVLVNNAGGTLVGAVEETSVTEAQSLFDTNVFGTLRTTQAVLPYMREQRSGRVVNVSSVLGFLPAPYMGLYSASKHAIEGLSETLDHEVRGFGVRVVLVEPSYTKTNLDLNAPHAASKIAAYDADRERVTQAVVKNVTDAPQPDGVAATIVEAALGTWAMRRTPKGQASLLSKLRRFLPAGPVDASLRKTFGLA
jgi:NAD(P)-dependent dehydrogenase (short-subunit alcohol dehydrogenase family)